MYVRFIVDDRMIQSKFPSYNRLYNNQAIPETITSSSSAGAISSTNTANANNNDVSRIVYGSKKRSKFTDSIYTHGVWRDTSMTAMTRQKSRDNVQKKRRDDNINRINATFDQEVQHIRKLQNELAKRQQQMAHAVIEKYSALTIQTCVRGYNARNILFMLKNMRFICTYISFRYKYKKKLKSVRIIYNCYRRYIFVKTIYTTLKQVKCVRLLKRYFRKIIMKKKATLKRVMDSIKVSFTNEMLLISASRAMRKILIALQTDEDRCRSTLNKLVPYFRRKKRKEYMQQIGNSRMLLYVITNLSLHGSLRFDDSTPPSSAGTDLGCLDDSKDGTVATATTTIADTTTAVATELATTVDDNHNNSNNNKLVKRLEINVLNSSKKRNSNNKYTSLLISNSTCKYFRRSNDINHSLSRDIVEYLKTKVENHYHKLRHSTHSYEQVPTSPTNSRKFKGYNNTDAKEQIKFLQSNHINIDTDIPIPDIPSIISGPYRILTMYELVWFIQDILATCILHPTLLSGLIPDEVVVPLMGRKRVGKKKRYDGRRNQSALITSDAIKNMILHALKAPPPVITTTPIVQPPSQIKSPTGSVRNRRISHLDSTSPKSHTPNAVTSYHSAASKGKSSGEGPVGIVPVRPIETKSSKPLSRRASTGI